MVCNVILFLSIKNLNFVSCIRSHVIQLPKVKQLGTITEAKKVLYAKYVPMHIFLF